MILNFKEWKNDLIVFQISEAVGKTVVANFGRLNPITVGHLLLMKKISEIASREKADAMLFSSHSHDPKKNPLPYDKKIDFLGKVQGKPANLKIMKEASVTNPFKMLEFLAQRGYSKIIIVGGSDRAAEYQKFSAYSEKLNAKVSFMSSGDRDADSEGVSGVSASLARKLVQQGNLAEFLKIVPFTKQIGTQMFNEVKKGMGL
jgi:nicotinic acid mononucleotide adenylyltransferase